MSADLLAWAEELAAQPRAETQDRRQRWEDFRHVFGTPEGRRVLALLCRWAGLFAPGPAPGDPYGLHVREGARLLALRILNELTAERPPADTRHPQD